MGQFASLEMEVDEGYVRSMVGEQALGLCRSRGSIPDHQRAKNEQLLRDAGRRATACPADVTSVAVVHCYTQPGLHSS